MSPTQQLASSAAGGYNAHWQKSPMMYGSSSPIECVTAFAQGRSLATDSCAVSAKG
jgi:hypothetical protein